MESIVLVGVKHCGKSTLGRLLAKRRSCPFVDSDRELEKAFFARTGKRASVREIFRALGEEKFRALEAETVKALASGGVKVIALGGGAVSNPGLDDASLKALGRIVWVDVPDAVALRRVLKNGLPPFLADAPDLGQRLAEINAKRRADFARIADTVFETSGELEVNEAARQLAQRLEEARS